MGMYVTDGLYADNKFTNLDIFALDIASGEYQDPQLGRQKVLNKINRAIQKGWIKIVPYKKDPFKGKNNDDDNLIGRDKDFVGI